MVLKDLYVTVWLVVNVTGLTLVELLPVTMENYGKVNHQEQGQSGRPWISFLGQNNFRLKKDVNILIMWVCG